MEIYNWRGESGQSYKYEVWPFGGGSGQPLKEHPLARPGCFIYAKRHTDGTWEPLYIDQADNIIVAHDKLLSTAFACAKQQGVTNLHTRFTDGENQRKDQVADLVLKYKPPCNS